MQRLWNTRRKEILVGAACLFVFLAVVIHFITKPEQSTAAQSDIGTMRIKEVLAAHPSYARLLELQAEERSLALLEKQAASAPEITAPQTDAAPFDDSVWQKNAQTVISTRVAIEREQKRLAEVYRKETEADYEARRKAIDDEYLNAILNLNLKIDNQRAMHGLRVTEEELAAERAVWEDQLAALKHERGMRQMQLYQAWQAEIAARVAARIEPEKAAWERQANAAIEAQKDEAARLRSTVEQRNQEAMEKALQEQEARKGAAERSIRLAALHSEVTALEEAIWRDVRSRAAKLAILHQFSLVLAAPEERALLQLPGARLFSARQYTPLISVGATDVTAEMVQEMQSIEVPAH